jgi:hypothetical protein
MAKGGARFGAGRPAHNVKAEHVARVDIRIWHKRGLLWDGGRNTWSWSRGDERAGSITFSVSEQSIRLTYAVNGLDASQTIPRTSTPCHYGGARPWFLCPLCQRRTALLYMRAGRFGCRHCQRVAYSSQSEDVMGRTWLKQRKLEARLCEDWQRPKGMWQRTYDRLMDRLADCELRREVAFSIVVARFLDQGV